MGTGRRSRPAQPFGSVKFEAEFSSVCWGSPSRIFLIIAATLPPGPRLDLFARCSVSRSDSGDFVYPAWWLKSLYCSSGSLNPPGLCPRLGTSIPSWAPPGPFRTSGPTGWLQTFTFHILMCFGTGIFPWTPQMAAMIPGRNSGKVMYVDFHFLLILD